MTALWLYSPTGPNPGLALAGAGNIDAAAAPVPGSSMRPSETQPSLASCVSVAYPLGIQGMFGGPNQEEVL